MTTYHITATNETEEGLELLALAETLARKPNSQVQVRASLKRPLTGPAKAIDEGLKELKAILAGEKKGIPFDKAMEELDKEN